MFNKFLLAVLASAALCTALPEELMKQVADHMAAFETGAGDDGMEDFDPTKCNLFDFGQCNRDFFRHTFNSGAQPEAWHFTDLIEKKLRDDSNGLNNICDGLDAFHQCMGDDSFTTCRSYRYLIYLGVEPAEAAIYMQVVKELAHLCTAKAVVAPMMSCIMDKWQHTPSLPQLTRSYAEDTQHMPVNMCMNLQTFLNGFKTAFMSCGAEVGRQMCMMRMKGVIEQMHGQCASQLTC